ncbi:hypothetical protein MAPG_04166 [Magnaporthiopsis poae ATCC 64411]|uniref:Uncharacterized protein n=1 Tax=Magnaporthiopsis poae (strain ATCC 64411 / 73-15) TaxID=644358 RepID=A0A0C4DVZ8_MAGP6|nr:hypothetical protein MAPG_04166 [Magnaporthiopsis poae ATCC 64411]
MFENNDNLGSDRTPPFNNGMASENNDNSNLYQFSRIGRPSAMNVQRQAHHPGAVKRDKKRREILPRSVDRTMGVQARTQLPAPLAYIHVHPPHQRQTLQRLLRTPSVGPCEECIAGKAGRRVPFGDACTNCYYGSKRKSARGYGLAESGTVFDHILVTADADAHERLLEAVNWATASQDR